MAVTYVKGGVDGGVERYVNDAGRILFDALATTAVKSAVWHNELPLSKFRSLTVNGKHSGQR